jgi:hypothetical protein
METAATAPASMKMVVSPSPSQPLTTSRRAVENNPMLWGREKHFPGRSTYRRVRTEKLPLPRVPNASKETATGMPCAIAARNR